MPSFRLNDRLIKAAQAEEKEYFLNDGDGLSLRIRPRSKDWFFIYRRQGIATPTKLMLGTYPTLKLADAREMAEKLRKQRQQGIDPKAQREEAARQQLAAQQSNIPKTVKELFERWQENYLTRTDKDGRMRRKDGGASIKRAFEKDVLPVIGSLPPAEVRKGHIAAILDKIASRGTNRMTNQTLSYLRQMFRFGLSRDYIEVEPTAALRKEEFGGKEYSRTRVLSEDEIRLLAQLLPKVAMEHQNQVAIWLILATACRVSELFSAEWHEIDLEAGEWLIPKEKTKNRHAHLVHLSAFALRHFQALYDKRQSHQWVFPAQRKEVGHLCDRTLQKQIKDRQRGATMKGRCKDNQALVLPGGEWKTHDLRRTASTLMGELGIRPDVIDRCQNHVEAKDVTRTYQRQELLAERRQAFDLLGQRLEILVNSDLTNVVSLSTKKRPSTKHGHPPTGLKEA